MIYLFIFASLFALAIDIYTIRDIVKSEEIKYLPKWAWIIILLLSFPLGFILYFLLGRFQYEKFDE